MKTKRKTTLKRKVRKKSSPKQVKVYPKKTRRYHLAIDKKLTAKKVGYRTSASGKKYMETRENRSDKNRKKRL